MDHVPARVKARGLATKFYKKWIKRINILQTFTLIEGKEVIKKCFDMHFYDKKTQE
jgi:hypothetical protein